MNAKFTVLCVAITLLVPSIGQGGQPIGTAKARGDFRAYGQAQQSGARSVNRSRPTYRYSAERSTPLIVESPVVNDEPSPVVAQAPSADVRRYSQAPAAENEAGVMTRNKPCPETSATAVPSSSGRRYSYAPVIQNSGNPVRRYSGNTRQSSQPTWSLPKTSSGKYEIR